MKFTWNPKKAKKNLKKHGVSFEEAITVFEGTYDIEFDRDHSSLEEERYIAKGFSKKLNQLVVVFIELEGDLIRIIQSRKI